MGCTSVTALDPLEFSYRERHPALLSLLKSFKGFTACGIWADHSAPLIRAIGRCACHSIDKRSTTVEHHHHSSRAIEHFDAQGCRNAKILLPVENFCVRLTRPAGQTVGDSYRRGQDSDLMRKWVVLVAHGSYGRSEVSCYLKSMLHVLLSTPSSETMETSPFSFPCTAHFLFL